MPIDPATLDPDPFRQFDAWLTEAQAAALPLPDAFALATADADGAPSVRMLLLRGHGPDGLLFYTNRASRKGRDLAANRRGAALFHWPALERQLRVSGLVEPLDELESAAYFVDRPRGSQLSAWASDQGEPIVSRAALEAAVAEADERFPDQVPLPPAWGGYRLIPERFEFWLSREDRLHDRVEYLLQPDGSWTRRRLQP
ncbi:MAG TPA: pyridoxamine 5'-phosphate oxidase [Candidatus Saccharimonadales bacterium]|nr:pyridoxamine 5'-phosphate oxidase [Candidatus Saccharimonadales bacterium]